MLDKSRAAEDDAKMGRQSNPTSVSPEREDVCGSPDI
jgi:hypothetical protein